MKRLIAMICACALLFSCAAADSVWEDPASVYPYGYDAFWIIPDSDSRLLTEGELWQYTRETLPYIRNEILARYGYAFEKVDFYNYFNAKPWYVAGGYKDEKVSRTAWANIELVKGVESAMKSSGGNPGGTSISQIISYQNMVGGFGDRLDYGNSRGVGAGRTLEEKDPNYQGLSTGSTRRYPVDRSVPLPRYCYTVDYIIPDSDVRPLSEGELWAYSRETLRYIRNEILARHGYTFKTEKFLSYFGGKSWYQAGGYSDDKLSYLEWTNVELIKKIEKEMDKLGIDKQGYLDIATIIYQQKTDTCPVW